MALYLIIMFERTHLRVFANPLANGFGNPLWVATGHVFLLIRDVIIKSDSGELPLLSRTACPARGCVSFVNLVAQFAFPRFKPEFTRSLTQRACPVGILTLFTQES